jgi:hypothetical protein
MIKPSRILLTSLVAVAFACSAFAQDATTATQDSKTTQGATAGASGDGKVLELKLPKPVFVGTPKNINVANLEPAGTRPPKIQVPNDVKNLAEGKEVTASDEEPIIGELEQITDGDKEAADGSYVEFGPGVQWVQIDLGEKAEIYAVAVWHYHQQARVFNDVIVKVADDADFITNVNTVFNNDNDNSAKQGVGQDKSYIETNEGKLIDAKGVKGRYVRLYTNGNTNSDTNQYIEVEVYGRPAK